MDVITTLSLSPFLELPRYKQQNSTTPMITLRPFLELQKSEMPSKAKSRMQRDIEAASGIFIFVDLRVNRGHYAIRLKSMFIVSV